MPEVSLVQSRADLRRTKDDMILIAAQVSSEKAEGINSHRYLELQSTDEMNNLAVRSALSAMFKLRKNQRSLPHPSPWETG